MEKMAKHLIKISWGINKGEKYYRVGIEYWHKNRRITRIILSCILGNKLQWYIEFFFDWWDKLVLRVKCLV